VLDSITLMKGTTETFEQAGRLGPTGLGYADAVNLAGALDLGDDLDLMVAYDDRLAEAAQFNATAVTAPA